MSICKLLSAGLVAVGVLVGGATVRLCAAPGPEPEKKDDQKKDDQKKDDNKGSGDKKAENPATPFDDMLKRLGEQGVPQEQIDQLRKQLQKAFEQMPGGLPGGFPNLPPGALPGVPGGLPNFQNLPNRLGGWGRGGRTALGENLRLGARLEKPSDTLVEQLDLPKGQGQVITQINDDSAAAKAGIKANDILLELDGKPVSSDAKEFEKQLGDIKADTAVDAVVLRKGKKETVKGISMPEEPQPTLPKRGRLGRGLPGGVLPVVP